MRLYYFHMPWGVPIFTTTRASIDTIAALERYSGPISEVDVPKELEVQIRRLIK